MKNHKSFELYRPNQLVDFLNFLKDNPEETFVYILIKPQTEERFYFDRYTGEKKVVPAMNILSASDYGHFVFCLEERSQVIFSPQPFVHKMKKNLKDFREQDYILCVGDPGVIGVSTAIAVEASKGKLNLLKWDRQEKRYYPLSFNLYEKGE
tara:strand:+ start:109 stop:564 length:456 start_codon:yes stop_codon:yes gene_type:complete